MKVIKKWSLYHGKNNTCIKNLINGKIEGCASVEQRYKMGDNIKRWTNCQSLLECTKKAKDGPTAVFQCTTKARDGPKAVFHCTTKARDIECWRSITTTLEYGDDT